MLSFGNNEEVTYQNHPQGKFVGVIYCFKNLGEKTNAFGTTKDQIMLRIEMEKGVGLDGAQVDKWMEPYTVKHEDGTEQEVKMPFSAPLFFNASVGRYGVRTGTQYPRMQKIRETVLDRQIDTKDEWYNVDAFNELIGVRVRYRVTHTPKDDGKGVWVNTDIIERSEDQDDIDTLNDFICVENAPKKEAEDTPQPAPAKGKGMPTAMPIAQKGNSILAGDKATVRKIAVRLKEKDVYDIDQVKAWDEWLDNVVLHSEVTDAIKTLTAQAGIDGVDIKDIVAVGTTGNDDLPF